MLPGKILADAQAVADFIASDQPHVDNIQVSKVDGWYRKFQPAALRDGNIDERIFKAAHKPIGKAEREMAGLGETARG